MASIVKMLWKNHFLAFSVYAPLPRTAHIPLSPQLLQKIFPPLSPKNFCRIIMKSLHLPKFF